MSEPEYALEHLLATRQALQTIGAGPAELVVPHDVHDRYARAPSLVQRRFDRIAGEASRAAAAGVQALVASAPVARAPAAARLARALDADIGQLLRLVR